MILRELNLGSGETNKRKTLLVSVPQWGEDAEIMVTQITVSGYMGRNTLQRAILERKDIPENKRAALLLCAQLLSVMVHPETGDFLLSESDLDRFESQVNDESLQALLLANHELNPTKEVEEPETLDTKKKPS